MTLVLLCMLCMLCMLVLLVATAKVLSQPACLVDPPAWPSRPALLSGLPYLCPLLAFLFCWSECFRNWYALSHLLLLDDCLKYTCQSAVGQMLGSINTVGLMSVCQMAKCHSTEWHGALILLKENHIEFREEELRNQLTSWLENPSVTNLLSKLECLLIGKPLQTGLILVGESHCILNNVMLSVAFYCCAEHLYDDCSIWYLVLLCWVSLFWALWHCSGGTAYLKHVNNYLNTNIYSI